MLMPENKICKSNILNYIGNSKVSSTLLEESKWVFTYFYCAYNSSLFPAFPMCAFLKNI